MPPDQPKKRENQFHSVQKIAEMLDVCPATVRKLIALKKLEAVKIERTTKVPDHAYDKYVASLAPANLAA